MEYDIIIVGAGPAGLSLACSLTNTSARIAIVEKQTDEQLSEPEFDGRDIALTHHSKEILNSLGVWNNMPDVSRIREARVLDGNSDYSLNFNTSSSTPDSLGYLVSNHTIRQTLYEAAKQNPNLDFLTGAAVISADTNHERAVVELDTGQQLQGSLLVAADSRFSETRRMLGIPASTRDFARVCIVCRMSHELPNDAVAYECFNYGRTLAVLPLNGNQSSIVVTAPMTDKDTIMGMTATSFSDDIQSRFCHRYGDMELITDRYPYPLVGVHASKFYSTRAALIGDAAVGMHPVTAHGFNLGLSGQEILAREITARLKTDGDIGNAQLLARYNRLHMRGTRPIYHGTNEIVRMFTDDRRPAKALRSMTLLLANHFPPVKSYIRNRLTESAGQRLI